MMFLALIMAILLPMLMAAAFLLGRHLQRRAQPEEQFSAVTRQHFELFQGGSVNEAAVENAKRRFRDLLERGEVATVEASLRPGMSYVFQVRALAEIGTDVAGRILERQLQRRLSDDQLEQAWYWIDLAGSLRHLHREESLPHLLRCAEMAGAVPLGHFFAAETVCFLGFAGYLRQPETALGRSALRLLHRALEGLRFGLPPHVVAEARLGETLENLWDHRPRTVHPLMVRVAHETLRFLRRAGAAKSDLSDEPSDMEAFDWQLSRLNALEPVFLEYLKDAPQALLEQFKAVVGQVANLPTGPRVGKDQHLADLLQALIDLRAEAGTEVLRLLDGPPFSQVEPAIEVLTWSKDPRVGPWLREHAGRRIPMQRRAQWRRRPHSPPRPSLAADIPYRAILRALRGHPSAETEKFLVLGAQDWDPHFRAAALGSLGWWEPLLKTEVLEALEEGRRDPSPEVRQSARAALGRLGERAALHWFRQGLTAENPTNIHEAIQVIATEGLTLLWPDLDRLADAHDSDIAHLAREALERMSEEIH